MVREKKIYGEEEDQGGSLELRRGLEGKNQRRGTERDFT